MNLAGPARTWIFQDDPKRFDIDGYLSTRPDTFVWFVNQHTAEIKVGDHVFMWRAIGGLDRKKSGVVAEATVLTPVIPLVEDAQALPFWRDREPALVSRNRVRMKLLRYAQPSERLQLDDLREDPVLSGLEILRQPWNKTNFPVTAVQAARLRERWAG